MRYLANQMSKDDEILLDCMRQDFLQDNIVVQNTHNKIYIYLLHNLQCKLIHISIGLTFETAFYGVSDVIKSIFDNEYHGDPILW